MFGVLASLLFTSLDITISYDTISPSASSNTYPNSCMTLALAYVLNITQQEVAWYLVSNRDLFKELSELICRERVGGAQQISELPLY